MMLWVWDGLRTLLIMPIMHTLGGFLTMAFAPPGSSQAWRRAWYGRFRRCQPSDVDESFLATTRPPTLAKRPHGLSVRSLGAKGVAIIDANNVRGRLGFSRATNAQFAAAVARWAVDEGLSSRVIVAVDHGPCACTMQCGAIVVTFAGPRAKADDAIVDDVRWLAAHGHAPLVVVTSDHPLRQRCASAFREGAAQLDSSARGALPARARQRGAGFRAVDATLLANRLEQSALSSARRAPAAGWEWWAASAEAAQTAGAAHAGSRRRMRAQIPASESTAEREQQAAALFADLELRCARRCGPQSGALRGASAAVFDASLGRPADRCYFYKQQRIAR